MDTGEEVLVDVVDDDGSPKRQCRGSLRKSVVQWEKFERKAA
jgi:hypothetical protein